MYSRRQGNCSQVLPGGYPPEGPMAEVLRAEAKTAGSSQRACKPCTYSAAPSWGPRRSPAKRVRWGEGGAKERNAVFGVSRKRNGADFAPTRGPGRSPAIFGYFPSLESNPPEAGPENEQQRVPRKRQTPPNKGNKSPLPDIVSILHISVNKRIHQFSNLPCSVRLQKPFTFNLHPAY